MPNCEGHKADGTMVSRIRNTLTVQKRAAIFEHTAQVALAARDEEARERAEKTERLRQMRQAAQRKTPTSRTDPKKPR
jgi:hypothetical protein